ncbi:MAG: hypothetical protein M0R51_08265 [Clostridia bacterium]|jgi:hypothetical protein|nr:hypothetical protein [Clostridia bacterium]
MKNIMYATLIFLLLCGVSTATPVITPIGNTNIVVANGTNVNFAFNSTEAIVTSHFILDGVDTTSGAQSMSYSFDEPATYYNVTVYAENGNGISNSIAYHVTTTRIMATAPVAYMDESRYDVLKENFVDLDYEGIMSSAMFPFTDLIGRIFYLVLFAMPFLLLWKQQEKMTIPTVLALFLGCLFIGFIPEQFKNFIIYAVILSFAANFFFMSRERR